MNGTVNLKRFCNTLRQCEEHKTGHEALFDTAGKRYLMERVLPSLVFGRPLRVRDLNLDAFDEDDIVDLIDYRSDELDVYFCLVGRLVACFQNSEAVTARQAKFF